MSRKGLPIILLLAMVIVAILLVNNPLRPSHQNSPPTPSTQGEDRMASQDDNHPGSLEDQPSMGGKTYPSANAHGDPRKENSTGEDMMEEVLSVPWLKGTTPRSEQSFKEDGEGQPKDPSPEPPEEQDVEEQDPTLPSKPPKEGTNPSNPPKDEVTPPVDPPSEPPKEEQDPSQEPGDPPKGIQVEELNEDDRYGPIIKGK